MSLQEMIENIKTMRTHNDDVIISEALDEALEIIKKQQEIITELKTIIEYNDEVIKHQRKNDELYYKLYMNDFIETVKNKIKEMEENDL